MEVVGYCTIHRDAKTGTGMNLEKFIGKDVRVMEFAKDGGVLVISADAQSMATFDKEDVYRKFECSISGDVICPPDMNVIEQMMYHTKVITRKGGYNNILRNMVIEASLMKGKFVDGFLFAKQ